MRGAVMKITVGAIVTAILCMAAVSQVEAKEKPKTVIQVAVLLDTSNSMDGLIDQAKTQLWKMVNELASAKKNGAAPDVRVALYEYGKSSLAAQEGYMRMITPFTGDLDKVSEELFALTTNGGDEYCGKVIKAAAEGLVWSRSSGDLKIIFIAGNEPFTQGNTDYRLSCKEAVGKGIIVNTIFCGGYDEGVKTNWKDGADLADGKYLNIDQNQKIVQIDAPQDKEIARLGAELNRTYLAYGDKGKEGGKRQEAQDRNALAAAPAVLAERTVAKASLQYKNSGWDLVDAVRENGVAVEKMKDEDLPVEMQKMSAAEKKAYVEGKAKEREKIQAQISKLNDERKKYVAQQVAKLSRAETGTLDEAMIKAVREQAARKHFMVQ